MADDNPTTNYQQSGGFSVGDLQTAAYMFAGLAMMLNIRLSYSAAPYALLRFKLPENLFSVFVRTTSSALELWCIPSMLLGNIMEQVYNQTQNTPSVHRHGITITDLKNKANKLKVTATTQSAIELATTQNTDLEKSGNTPQPGLATKAGELKNKASALSGAANTLETAATGPLESLKATAIALKNAAKKDTSGKGQDGLFENAQLLEAKARTGDGSSEATKVIEAFETVEKLYLALMTEYKKILDKPEQAAKLTSDNKEKVNEVVKKYHAVKTTYYQMLITYRIQKKADAFHTEATQLKTQAENAAKQQTTSPLGKLHTAANQEMAQLVQKANDLKLEADKLHEANDTQIVQKYLAVEKDYKALEAIEAFEAALKAQESKVTVERVKDKFDALQKSYVNVLKLRVQELSNKADNLKTKANELSRAVRDLQTPAEALRDAASQGSDNSGLKEKAAKLVSAINTAAGDIEGTKANEVIKQFEAVTARYNDLAKQPKYKDVVEKLEKDPSASVDGNDQNAKNVYDAYNGLKNLYDSILKFTKIKYYSGELHSAATDTVNAENVITNFNAVATAYNQIDDKSQVETQFNALKEEYSEAIYKYKFHFLTIPSMFTNWLNFLTFVILLIIFVTGGDKGHVTGYYVIMAISGFVFGINMVLVYAVDYRYLPFYMAGENSFPMVTSLILYFATSIFGNRRKYNSDYLVVVIDVSIAILIALVASVLWTVAFVNYRTPMASDMTPKPWPLVSPVAMVIVGMGLVYSIYPGIAPGMIVPFYLIDKIEMVLLVATAFPPVIIAFLRKYAENWSPQTKYIWPSGFGGWTQYQDDSTTVHAYIWHLFDILIPLKIALAIIFIYSLHYRDSSIARSIINQPKMSTALTITFYMCHEILLALGFPGMVGNGGAGGAVLLPTQYAGALLMVFLAFYSIGYITEYKKHDPSHWPTEGMTKWNALCYWLKMASKITNKNFKQLFTTDLRRD